mmetsp:Transcript_32402/g.59455  ORF Transcript_32402/g.59455 Transcript_32402/m.59455 type:complete len:85 (+) Transcript_32402:431-685(+)
MGQTKSRKHNTWNLSAEYTASSIDAGARGARISPLYQTNRKATKGIKTPHQKCWKKYKYKWINTCIFGRLAGRGMACFETNRQI